MTFEKLSMLDKIAIELDGMCCVLNDNGDTYQSNRLHKISERLIAISNSEREATECKSAEPRE